ncbi:hypothetical protein N780_01995 [Pontibacillus chungwhensis BH030062]|uniref:Uncharacterized protein n=1 Tax=Pontibacillus chungwhensis BH030062 TaxID=1385513 RepID=A0A0A2V0U8_9BACI|nr:hypothetical protein [Pontibacillus chungwhensis]KGP92406.1 hypothetical protein N780_01995 [Pontibacillus chungwhensis BH030062]
MNSRVRNVIVMIVLATTGIGTFIYGLVEDLPFGVAGLGLALAGISIEVYIRNRRDTTTANGEKRSEIEKNDERNVLIHAKSGEAVNLIMDAFIVIAALLSVYLKLSTVAQTLLFSLLIIRIMVRPLVKRYYDVRM